MKTNRIISVLAVMAIAPAAFADRIRMHDEYVGIEAIQYSQDYKPGYGKNLFKKNPQGYSLFGGMKFSDYFGAELGFEDQFKKRKNAALPAGSLIPSNFVLGLPATFHTTIQSTHPYLGLFGATKHNLFGMGHVHFQLMVGASASRVKAKETTLTSGGVAVNPPTIRTYTKTKVVPMVKLSATYMVTNAVGIRLSGDYRNMSSFKISAAENAATKIELKDTWGVGLGLTYSFCK